MDIELITCERCGCTEDVIETADGHLLCQSCLDDEGYVFCHDCNDYYHENRVEAVNFGWRDERYICDDCRDDSGYYFYCEDCQEWYSDGYRESYDVGRAIVCEACYSDNYVTCYDCGAIVAYDNAYEDEDEERWFCEDCAHKARYIKSYSYKPTPKAKGKVDDTEYLFKVPEDCKELLFGVELEIDGGYSASDVAEALCSVHDDIYCKRDGSLGDDGVEIVTHPCTLEYHMDLMGWESICKIAKDKDYRSHDTRTCGLHVHVGRRQLGETKEERENTIAKIVILVDRHWAAMKQFSRRRENQLNNWAKAPELGMENHRYSESTLKTAALYNHTRYAAVNLGNRSTIEFRLFNGSLVPNTIKATLQLVSNICEYAMKHTVKDCLGSSWENITGYKTYPELEMYLKARGMTEVDSAGYVYLRAEPLFEEKGLDIGDRVLIVDPQLKELYSREAVIAAFDYSRGWSDVIVEFGKKIDCLHSCEGRVPSYRGYFVSKAQIEILKNF